MSTLANRLKMAIAEKGCKLSQLAIACGVRPPSVSDWINGETKAMKSATALRAAKFLDVNMLWLTEGAGPMRIGSDNESGQASSVVARMAERDLPEIVAVATLMRSMTAAGRLRVVDFAQGVATTHHVGHQANAAQ